MCYLTQFCFLIILIFKYKCMKFTEKMIIKKQFDLHCTIGLSQTNLHPSVFVEDVDNSQCSAFHVQRNSLFMLKRSYKERWYINVIIPWGCLIDILHTWMNHFQAVHGLSFMWSEQNPLVGRLVYLFFQSSKRDIHPIPNFSLSLSLCKIQWAKDQSKRHVRCIMGMGRVNVLLLCYCVVLPLGEE